VFLRQSAAVLASNETFGSAHPSALRLRPCFLQPVFPSTSLKDAGFPRRGLDGIHNTLTLSEDAFYFFREADIHDAELMELVIVDGSRPAPLAEPPRPWVSANNHPVRVSLRLLDAVEEFLWELSYVGVRRITVDFPTASPFHFSEGEGFGDWGYHELSPAAGGFLCHEILFASGSVLLFEFQSVEVTRAAARSKER
jgi:hypothetical protein